MGKPQECDWTFPGIGRLKKATGARTMAEYRRRRAILDELYDAGRWDVLEAIRDGRASIREACAAYRAHRLDALWGDLLLGRELVAAVTAWLPGCARAASTRARYAVSWSSLLRAEVLGTTATIRDLDRVDWPALRAAWPGGRHDWRHLRGFLSRFLTVQLGVEHPFRKAVLARIPAAGRIPGRVPDLTPEAFWRIVEALPAHVRAAPVVIVLTGMRIGEFCAARESDLRPLTKAVRIPGTKTDLSEDVIPVHPAFWPWIERAIPCPVGTWRLRELWRRACTAAGVEGVTPHDLRHCLGQWLVAAGRPEASVQGTLRHASAAMTRRYTTQDGRAQDAQVIGDLLLRTHDATHTTKRRGGRSA